MKWYFPLITLFLIPQLVSGQKITEGYYDLVKKATHLYLSKEYKNSGINYSIAFKTSEKSIMLTDRFNAARSWTLAGYPDSAFIQLETIIHEKCSPFQHIITERDFDTLHSDKRWNPLCETIRKEVELINAVKLLTPSVG